LKKGGLKGFMEKKIISYFLIIVMIAASIHFSTFANASEKNLVTKIIYPEADASVSQTNSGRNYGKTKTFGVKNGVSEEYMRFDLSSIHGFIESASMEVTTISTTSAASTFNIPINVIGVSNNSWVEGNKDNKTADPGELTWANKPVAGAVIGDTGVVVASKIGGFTPTQKDETVSTDLTSAIVDEYKNDQKISMCIQSSSGSAYTYFNSREATSQSVQPKLKIDVDESYTFPTSSVSAKEGQAVSFFLNKQTDYGEDVDLSIKDMPSGASFDKETGKFSWTPDYTQSGSYAMTIIVDKGGKIACSNVEITVSDETNAPNFNDLSNVTTDEGKPVSFSVSAIFSSGNQLKYGAENLPSGATIDSNTGEFNWTPNYTQSGTYNVVFTASSDSSLVAKKTATITVNDVNWPIVSNVDDMIAEPEQELSFSVSATDPEDGTISYQALDLPYGATFDSKTGYFRWVPDANQVGEYTIGFTATDKAVSPVTNVRITVTNDLNTDDAESVYNSAVVGYKTGEYFKNSKDKLKNAIDKAKAIILDSNSIQSEIDQAKVNLQAAVVEFKNSVIKKSTGDLNNDGSIDDKDLSTILSEYGKTASSDIMGDIDGDGKVDLKDAVFVAMHISKGDELVERTFTILPSSDTYVKQGSTNKYFWLNTLDIQNNGENSSNTSEAFLKFDVSKDAIPGIILDARFCMNLKSSIGAIDSTPIKTDFISDDTWDELALTYNGKPSSSDILGAENTIKQNTDGINQYSANIPATVLSENDGDGTLSLRVHAKDANSQLYSFISQDSGTKDDMPRIVVTAMVEPDVAAVYDNIMADLANLNLGDLNSVTSNLNLATTGSHGTQFKWTSSDEQVVTDAGEVTRPKASLEDKSVYLTLTATNGQLKLDQKYRVTVSKEENSDSVSKVDYALAPVQVEDTVKTLIASKWNNDKYTFTNVTYPNQVLTNIVTVNPGESIQAAVDSVSTSGGGVVLLKEGIHVINSTINMKSNVSLVGEGEDRTIIKQGPDLNNGAITGDCSSSASPGLTNIVLKDFTLEGVRGLKNIIYGIYFSGNNLQTNPINKVMLQNITVKNWTDSGIHMKRTSNIIMDHVTSRYNGEADSLYHNCYFLFVNKILQSDCDFSRPVRGKGAKYTSAEEVIAQRVTIKDCLHNGIQSDNAGADHIIFHKYSITNCGAAAMWFPCENYNNKYSYTEDPTYAPQGLILSECNISNNRTGGIWRSVKNSYIINSTFNNLRDDLELLNCDVKLENSTFNKDGQPTIYKSVFDLPDPIL
jgi:hypothetical protein